MCIVLATTAHPSYALIILDNRDEFILRPTSRPHWWTSHYQEILSARDLQRAEQGTWLGITKTGNFAVLTNYRETDTHDKEHPVQGARSRGGMVTAWLTAPEEESTEEFVKKLLGGEGVKGVGGFSLVCGKLRRHSNFSDELEPLAIISNRVDNSDEVPWIAGKRGEAYGLSNTSYLDPITWPKVKMGKEKLLSTVQAAIEADLGEEELVDQLYAILDTNTLPEQDDQDFETYIYQLRKSIFIPSIGKVEEPQSVSKADVTASSEPLNGHAKLNGDSEVKLKEAECPETQSAMTGIYGTQRQTIILVDWEGHVTFRERSLYDMEGMPIERGNGDMKFEFQFEGWDGESKGNEFHPHAVL
jgi:uncharacterized protein with NRDE domain